MLDYTTLCDKYMYTTADTACSGFAWCGANSKDELMSAVISACNCNRDNSCIVIVHGVPLTAVGVLGSAINTSLPRYYVGSSSTGPVGGSNVVCQDVSCK